MDASQFQPSEMLRLNTSIAPTKDPNRLGVLGGDLQGFPNGRRLADDVIDISIQAVEGAAQTGKLVDALAAGDKVDANDNAFGGDVPVRRAARATRPRPTPSAEPRRRGARAAPPVEPRRLRSGARRPGSTGSEGDGTDTAVQPAAASSSWDDPAPMALAGGAGAALFAGAGRPVVPASPRGASSAARGPADRHPTR